MKAKRVAKMKVVELESEGQVREIKSDMPQSL